MWILVWGLEQRDSLLTAALGKRTGDLLLRKFLYCCEGKGQNENIPFQTDSSSSSPPFKRSFLAETPMGSFEQSQGCCTAAAAAPQLPELLSLSRNKCVASAANPSPPRDYSYPRALNNTHTARHNRRAPRRVGFLIPWLNPPPRRTSRGGGSNRVGD